MNDDTPQAADSPKPEKDPQAADDVEQQDDNPGRSGELDFPVIGVGASAGGLHAFEELLRHLPADVGAAVIFVQHLSPDHTSNLPDILMRSTNMTVREADDGMALRPNQVFVIPPNRDLAVMHGVLHLMTRPEAPARHMPIDYLFRSLAEDQGRRAIGVVLSGTGSDGSAGLRAIKAEGGITLAQDEDSAGYSGMPHAAIATGQVDLVLPPKQLAKELVRIVRHPQIHAHADTRGRQLANEGETLQKIFLLLRRATGVDFSLYKQSTVERRIARRLVVHKVESLGRYLQFLQRTPSELHALFDDMLINVTGFFRDPETFDALKERIFPQIVRDKSADTPIRLWVPGCSTGEEAYSLAIALLEYLGREDLHLPIQVFATDISESAIEKARHGRYPENIAGDVSQDRLRRFFSRTGEGFQVSKALRDLCVFATQNVVKDPPFSNLDLLSCRNLLIYLGPGLQKRVIPTFHYALNPNGFLLLGRSETIGAYADLFSLVDREQKVYAKKPAATRLPPELSARSVPFLAEAPEPAHSLPHTGGRDLEREAEQLLLNRYAPPGVIVDPNMEILHFQGRTERFLAPAPGAASLNLLKMARPGLTLDLRAMLHEVRKTGKPVRKNSVKTAAEGEEVKVDIEILPLGGAIGDNPHFLVLFRESPEPSGGGAGAPEASSKKSEAKPAASAGETAESEQTEVDRLQRELDQLKATMQSIIEDSEATNEELRAANEEIQSANEELQSTNEELETAKEELQSTNEELITLNTELENQNAEANRAIDDFENLHRAVNIPVILLDGDLKIRRFTAPAAEVLKLRDADEGRHIGELKLGIKADGLADRVRDVLHSLNTLSEEVESEDGRWYSLRIRPYRTADDRINGAVMLLIDVTSVRLAHVEARAAQALAEGVVRTVRQPLLVLDGDLRVLHANHAFQKTFEVEPAETEGRRVGELGDGQWNHLELNRLLKEIIPRDSHFESFEIVHDFPKLGQKRVLLDARRVDQGNNRPYLILLGFSEIRDA